MTAAPIRVAILDDDESVRRALVRLLRTAGIVSEAFGAGEDYLQSLSHHAPDCLLLDVRMPDMSGEEVLERLTAMQCQTPVVIITAHSVEGERLCSRFPCVGVCVKPLDDTNLLARIREAVSTQRHVP
jgi:FixJ family two-component response regulator